MAAAPSHRGGAPRIARPRRDPVVVVVRASDDDVDDDTSAEDLIVEVEDPQTSSSSSSSSSDVAPSSDADASSPLGDLISSPLFYVTFGILGGVGVVQKFENAALVLAAFPIVGLTLLSKSDFGRRLEENILERRPALEAKRSEVERLREEAMEASPLYGEARPLLPGISSPPPHLTGTLAGDRGFDPLRLGKTPESLARGVELELLHARWAMLAVVGVAVPEALSIAGALPEGAALAEPVWWKVGAAKLNGESLNYGGLGGFVIAGGQGVAVIALCQLVLMGGPEYARYVGIRSLEPVGVYLPGDKNYPGGAPFDPFGLSDDAERFEWQKVAEIKHGRLAMLAMAGCAAQAIATRVGPVENLRDVAERVAETLGNR